MTAAAFVLAPKLPDLPTSAQVSRHDAGRAEGSSASEASPGAEDPTQKAQVAHSHILWGLGSDPKAWSGIEAVAAARVVLEAENRLNGGVGLGDDLPGRLDTLRLAILSDRRRRNVARRAMRRLAQEAARLSRLERTTRVFCWIHVILNALELALGNYQGAGALIALLAVVGLRFRWLWAMLIYIVWLVADLGLDIALGVVSAQDQASSDVVEVRLRALLISGVVQALLVMSTLYITSRYAVALRKWQLPRQDPFGMEEADAEAARVAAAAEGAGAGEVRGAEGVAPPPAGSPQESPAAGRSVRRSLSGSQEGGSTPGPGASAAASAASASDARPHGVILPHHSEVLAATHRSRSMRSFRHSQRLSRVASARGVMGMHAVSTVGSG